MFLCVQEGRTIARAKLVISFFLCILFQFQSLYIITCLQVFQTLYINLSVQLSIYLNILVRIKIKSYFYMYSPNHIFVQRSEVTNFKICIFMVQVLIIMKMFLSFIPSIYFIVCLVSRVKRRVMEVSVYIYILFVSVDETDVEAETSVTYYHENR